MQTPAQILKNYWNYNEFRSPQEEIISTVLRKKNSIVLLPTGGGKSLCYQIPALLSEGICIVISPLIALINDQVNALKEKNIKAIALTSQLNENETIIAFDNLQFGNYKFLYLSPEKLQSPFIQDKIKQLNVSIIAIDEAHCISEWGHDFRPSYLQLNVLKKLHSSATFIALTGTATQKVLDDIALHLEIENPQLFKKSFYRDNLQYSVIETEDIYGKLIHLLSKTNNSAIIYTNNRKQTKEVCSFLNRNNFKSSYYHGGLSVLEKEVSYKKWIKNETPVMVATNAFGMGIDKPDVRMVIHINTPNSIENYIQEAGRAGRDGKPSNAIILTNNHNLFETENRFNSNIASTKFVKKIYHHLNQFYTISLGELPENSFDFSLQEFCLTYHLNLLKTYNALKILERENILIFDENFSKKSTLQITVSNSQLFKFMETHPKESDIIKAILRSYGGIFDYETIINEFSLAKKILQNNTTIINKLHFLHNNGIVNYKQENTNSKLYFLVPREDDYTINKIAKHIEQQNVLKYQKLKSVFNYILNNNTCRNIQLLTYFEENDIEPCNKCDVCVQKNFKPTTQKTLINQILELLQNNPLSTHELALKLNCANQEIIKSLKILLEKNKIAITSQNKFKLNI